MSGVPLVQTATRALIRSRQAGRPSSTRRQPALGHHRGGADRAGVFAPGQCSDHASPARPGQLFRGLAKPPFGFQHSSHIAWPEPRRGRIGLDTTHNGGPACICAPAHGDLHFVAIANFAGTPCFFASGFAARFFQVSAHNGRSFRGAERRPHDRRHRLPRRMQRAVKDCHSGHAQHRAFPVAGDRTSDTASARGSEIRVYF